MSSLNQSYGPTHNCIICFRNGAKTSKALCSLANNDGTAQVTCKGCQMQRYCSLSHLVEDREEHEPLCQVLADLMKFKRIRHPLLIHGRIEGLKQLQLVICQLKLILQVKLRRPLLWREHILIGQPAVCRVCLRTNPLEACTGCGGVAYCHKNHRNEDRICHGGEECRTLAMMSSPFRQLDSKLNIKEFKPITDLAESHLIDTFFQATSIPVSDNPWINFDQYDVFSTCSTFSGVASMCYALKHVSFDEDRDKPVIVYVMGATDDHLRYFQEMHLRFLLTMYQRIMKLELYFIGPSLDQRSPEVYRDRKSKRIVEKRFYESTFAEFPTINRANPNLILLLQPDFLCMSHISEELIKQLPIKSPYSDSIDWQQCLIGILQNYGVPICYTSLSKAKALSDFTAVKVLARDHKIAVKRTFNIMENPYREILPLYNPFIEDNEIIVYNNNYLEIVFTSSIS
ncbi:uncharacterized protein Dana_GF12872 [Drosophila ananassae]|uniref:MYND-type domain-containing protein n=1 Tax=Drosophila ananassae TaxID=7217 RepID=B3MCM0_DROAN|nr:uncharacterized protein LOC6495718 [Drosophila ananassae]EDV36254.2 uncharacterized protein Dana_GF12872 [Drosophila ananassae]